MQCCGSGFIWVRGPGFRIWRYKIEGKTDFNQQILGGFFQEIKFFKFEPKKVSLEV